MAIHIILFIFLLFGVVYTIITPPFESPDEFLHLDYINYVSRYKSLPNQYEGVKNPEIFVGQGHQHPLYYVIMAIPVYLFAFDGEISYNHPSNDDKNWKGGTPSKAIYSEVFPYKGDKFLFYLIRFISVLFSVVNLYSIYRISSLFSKNSFYNLLPVIITASLPQFQFISSVINNDAMANMLASISIYYLLFIIKSPEKTNSYLLAALYIALGILVKKTMLFLLPCAIILMIFLLIKNRNKGHILKHSVLFIFITVLISSFVFIRNFKLYNEFLAGTMERTTLIQFVEVKSLFSYYFIQPFTPGMLNSFIGVFGWMNLPLPRYIEVIYLILFSAGFLCSFYVFVKNNEIKILFLFFIFAACLGGVIYFNLTFTQYQGRYMFPVLSAISVITSYGIYHFFSLFRNNTIKKCITVIALVIIFIFDIIGVVTLYNHYY